MATVYLETYTKPPPSAAEVFTRKGERFARWTDRAGRKLSGKRIPGTDRALIDARTYTAKYRDGTGRVRKVATGRRDRDAALIVLVELERQAERLRSGVLTAAEDAVRDHSAAPIERHVEGYLTHLARERGKGGKPQVSPKQVDNVRHRLKRVFTACGLKMLRDLSRGGLAAGSPRTISSRSRRSFRGPNWSAGVLPKCCRSSRSAVAIERASPSST